jgi:hypothetical protein
MSSIPSSTTDVTLADLLAAEEFTRAALQTGERVAIEDAAAAEMELADRYWAQHPGADAEVEAAAAATVSEQVTAARAANPAAEAQWAALVQAHPEYAADLQTQAAAELADAAAAELAADLEMEI